MAVKIEDSCICCGACIDECPVEAIVDDNDNPINEGIYYVYQDKCVECLTYHEVPACAMACPTEGCFTWGVESEVSTKSRTKEGDSVIQ